MDSENCKVCGFRILLGGRYPDQVAQENGYCGAGCEEVDAALKACAKRAASNG